MSRYSLSATERDLLMSLARNQLHLDQSYPQPDHVREYLLRQTRQYNSYDRYNRYYIPEGYYGRILRGAQARAQMDSYFDYTSVTLEDLLNEYVSRQNTRRSTYQGQNFSLNDDFGRYNDSFGSRNSFESYCSSQSTHGSSERQQEYDRNEALYWLFNLLQNDLLESRRQGRWSDSDTTYWHSRSQESSNSSLDDFWSPYAGRGQESWFDSQAHGRNNFSVNDSILANIPGLSDRTPSEGQQRREAEHNEEILARPIPERNRSHERLDPSSHRHRRHPRQRVSTVTSQCGTSPWLFRFRRDYRGL